MKMKMKIEWIENESKMKWNEMKWNEQFYK